jgi:hypothetical protein
MRSFIISLHHIIMGVEMKEDEIDEICNAQGRRQRWRNAGFGQ